MTWRTVLCDGDPRSVILDEARLNQSDLIVVGASDHSAVARLLLGDVAAAIVRASWCDVLVVR